MKKKHKNKRVGHFKYLPPKSDLSGGSSISVDLYEALAKPFIVSPHPVEPSKSQSKITANMDVNELRTYRINY